MPLALVGVLGAGGGFHAYAVTDRGPTPPADAAAEPPGGQVETLAPTITHVRLSGEGYALGRSHGTLLRSSIQEVVRTLHQQVLRGNTAGRDVALVKAWQLDAHIPARYRLELRGVADGAGVDYADVLLINAYDDLIHLLGCSSAIVLPEGGEPLRHGRNLDYPIEALAKFKVVFDIKTRGVSLRTIGFPGYIGVLTGMSSRGLSLSSHTSAVKRNGVGVPSGILYRQVLEESEDIDGMVAALRAAPRTIGNNLALGDARRGAALAVELSAASLATRAPAAGRLFVTNHYQTAALQAEQDARLYAAGSGSTARVRCLSASLGPQALSRAPRAVDLQRALSEEPPSGTRGWRTPANAGTVQSVVMEPVNGRLFLATGLRPPVTRGGYRELAPAW